MNISANKESGVSGLVRSPISYIGILIILFLCYAFSMVDRQILAILASPIQADRGIDDFQLSLLLGPAFALAYIVFGIPFGYLSDKWSRPKTIVLGLFIWMAGTFACGLAGSFVSLFIFRALVGAGEAALSPSAHAIIAANVPRKRLSLAMAVYTWGSTLGIGASMMLGGLTLGAVTEVSPLSIPLLDTRAPWQIVFMLAALPGLVLLPLALRLPDDRKAAAAARITPEESSSFVSYAGANKWFLASHFTAFGLSNLVVYSTLVWAPQYLERQFQLPISQIGLSFGLVTMVCPILGGLVSSLIVDRLFQSGMRDAHMRYYFWVLLVAGPVAAFGFFSGSLIAFWIAMIVMMTAMNPILAVAGAALQIAAPAGNRARVSAAFISFVNLTGGVFGPLLIGALVQFVFQDRLMLGVALGSLTLGSVVLAVPLLWIGCRHMQATVARAEELDRLAALNVQGVQV